jgi:hypothetical protein
MTPPPCHVVQGWKTAHSAVLGLQQLTAPGHSVMDTLRDLLHERATLQAQTPEQHVLARTAGLCSEEPGFTVALEGAVLDLQQEADMMRDWAARIGTLELR